MDGSWPRVTAMIDRLTLNGFFRCLNRNMKKADVVEKTFIRQTTFYSPEELLPEELPLESALIVVPETSTFFFSSSLSGTP